RQDHGPPVHLRDPRVLVLAGPHHSLRRLRGLVGLRAILPRLGLRPRTVRLRSPGLRARARRVTRGARAPPSPRSSGCPRGCRLPWAMRRVAMSHRTTAPRSHPAFGSSGSNLPRLLAMADRRDLRDFLATALETL